jgi:hypothetical protein
MKNNSQCEPFLNLVLLQLEMSTGLPTSDATFVDTFNRAADEGAFYDSSGRTDDYGDTIVCKGRLNMGINLSKAQPGGIDSLEATVVHEMIHGATRQRGGYTHYEMASAAYTVGRILGLVPSGVAKPMIVMSEAANVTTPGFSIK